MKIFHTSDWHIGNTFFGNDRGEEHRAFFDFLLEAMQEQKPDALVVAGDVFDTSNPPAAAQALYYSFLHDAARQNPGMQIVIIAGNHDSAGRLEAPAPILAAGGITVLGSVHCDDEGEPDFNRLIIPLTPRGSGEPEVVCLAVPYMRSYELPGGKSFADSMAKFFSTLISEAHHRYGKHMPLVLAAHFYACGSEIADCDHSERIVVGGEEGVDASDFSRKLDYVALGHIHKAQHVSGMEHVRYAGSALPMSFAEKHYRHGVECVELNDDGSVTVGHLPFTPPHPIVSIPERGALSYAEALDAIDRLPSAGKRDSRDEFPYVEVRIDAGEPDPAMPQKIREHFEGKAAILCSIKRIESAAVDYKELEVRTTEELRRLTPQSVAQTIYRKRFGGDEMPPALLDMLRAAEQAALTTSEEQ